MEGRTKQGLLTSVKRGRCSRQPRLTLCDCAPWFLPPARVDERRHGAGAGPQELTDAAPHREPLCVSKSHHRHRNTSRKGS